MLTPSDFATILQNSYGGINFVVFKTTIYCFLFCLYCILQSTEIPWLEYSFEDSQSGRGLFMAISGHIGVLRVTRQCKRRVIVTLLSPGVQLSWQTSCQLSLCSFVDKTNGTSANPAWRQCDAETLTHTHTHTHTLQ